MVHRPHFRFFLGLVVALALGMASCRGRQSAAPVPTPPPPSSPPAFRVGVVDLQAVARAHPRWKELDALNKQLSEVQGTLDHLPPPPVPPADIQRMLDEESKRLRAEFEKEIEFLRGEGKRRLEGFAETLRQEQQAKLDATRKELETTVQRAVIAKRDELNRQLRTAEDQIREEYRYPLLNLRLRAEVAGLTSEEEARQILRQMQALQQEREDRIRTKADELDKTFQEFQKAKEAEVNAQLKARQDELNAEAQQRLQDKQREVQAEFARQAAEREKGFREELERRRQQFLETAEAQVRRQQTAFLQDESARSQRLRTELAALQQQRARLEDSILAEVKIEVAAIAQERKLDVVLTRYVANLTGIDITPDVVRKLKR